MKKVILCFALIISGCGGDGSGPDPAMDGSNKPPDSGSSDIFPDVPSGLSSSSGDTQIVIDWNDISGATSYNIYWNTTGNITVLDEKIENVTPPYLHSNISNNTTYYYVVTAVNDTKESDLSSEIFETPLTSNIVVPTEVRIISGDGRVRVMWNSVVGVDGYIIYWSTSDNPSDISSFRRSNTVHVQDGLNNGSEYTFNVSSFNTVGESARSKSVIAVPDLFSSSGISMVSAGHWGTTCAVRTDGSLWCWGDNSNGVFGNGTEYSTRIPVQINTDSDWRGVSVGVNHTCALKADDSLWCWGLNDYGQIAVNGVSRSNIPVQVGLDRDWRSVHIGGNSTCALKIDGSLWCWGKNKIDSTVGVLGVGSYSENVLIPSQVGISSNWTSIDGYEGYLCALNNVGELWCWGNIVGSNMPLFIDGTGWLDVDVSGASDLGTCLIKQADGSRWCWGDNRDGRLGNGTTGSVSSLSQMSNDSGWMDISGGVDHICGLHTNKSISCWGYDRYRLGAGTDADRQPYPTPIAGNSQWLQLDTGGVHTCAVRDDNTLWCWGSGIEGQLGIGGAGSSAKSIPVAVTNADLWP